MTAAKTRAKQAIREKIRKEFSSRPPRINDEESKKIRDLIQLDQETKIAIFAPTANEPNLFPLLDLTPSVEWYLPMIQSENEMIFSRFLNPKELKIGKFGILEPTTVLLPSTALDLIICPGLAFTREGLRLGQGGGYYDRALSKIPHLKSIGVCFDFQIQESLPYEEHDLSMDQVIHASGESLAQNQESEP